MKLKQLERNHICRKHLYFFPVKGADLITQVGSPQTGIIVVIYSINIYNTHIYIYILSQTLLCIKYICNIYYLIWNIFHINIDVVANVVANSQDIQKQQQQKDVQESQMLHKLLKNTGIIV